MRDYEEGIGGDEVKVFDSLDEDKQVRREALEYAIKYHDAKTGDPVAPDVLMKYVEKIYEFLNKDEVK